MSARARGSQRSSRDVFVQPIRMTVLMDAADSTNSITVPTPVVHQVAGNKALVMAVSKVEMTFAINQLVAANDQTFVIGTVGLRNPSATELRGNLYTQEFMVDNLGTSGTSMMYQTVQTYWDPETLYGWPTITLATVNQQPAGIVGRVSTAIWYRLIEVDASELLGMISE